VKDQNRSRRIEADYRALWAQPKDEVVAAYPTRLSKAHLMAKPKEVMITGILEARYGRKAVAARSNS
jgi:hypothetical protein